MNTEKQMLDHLVTSVMFHIYETNSRSNENEKGEDAVQKVMKRGEYNYRLLQLFLMLEPCLEYARKEFPESQAIFDWCERILKQAREKNPDMPSCKCAGCDIKQENT